MNRQQARRNFHDVSQGKRRQAHMELAEAKARLRRVDENLDISPALNYLSKGDWRSALLALTPLAVEQVKQENLLVPMLMRWLPYVYELIFTGRKTAD